MINAVQRISFASTVVLAAALFSGQAFAQLAPVTSGDICAPVNVAKSIRTIQNIRGNIVNISSDETISVSCPLTTFFPATQISVTAIIINGANVTQSPRCVLREVGLANNVMTTEISTIDIDAGSGDVFVFDSLPVKVDTNRFNLTCSLPPQTSLGALAVESS
jgi:hypothetical protein